MIVKDLQGQWGLCLDGEKQYTKPPKAEDTIYLPDSTAHAQKGRENTEPTTDFMRDRFYFEGYAWFSRKIEVEEAWTDKVIHLFLERTRISTVYIDGKEIDTKDSLCGYHVHDLTGRVTAGCHVLTIRVNNTDYPTKGGHMTSPDTQTNWNGIVGRIELQIKEACYPANLRVDAQTPEKVVISAAICGADAGTAQVCVCRKDGEILYRAEHGFSKGKLDAEIALEGENLLWDEYHTNLLEAEVSVGNESATTVFGIRKLSTQGRRLLVNDKQVFWRGKHDGLVFPSTGYAPMTVDAWKQVFATAKAYGINHYRFHTCCPPDAAFVAADEMGIYMEPELPFWGTIAAPSEEGYNEAEQAYLIEEGFRILRDFGNHPSFVMLSMGNELWGSMERINGFLHDFKQFDRRHFYTQGSNNFQFCPAVLEEEDVLCGVRLSGERLYRGSYAMCDAPQGHIQTEAPNTSHNYDDMIAPVQVSAGEAEDGYIEIQYGTGTKKVKAVSGEQALIPQVPVISHEVGQYDFFPDFSELSRYEGSQQPLYLEVYKERMEKSGTFLKWQDFFRATGTFAIDCYRREIEAALRSRELSGFQLLDLQDFPGQCVALVGVLNAWMDSKGLITPQKWRQFCNDTVILAECDSFVAEAGQKLQIPVRLSVCDRDGFDGTKLTYQICLITEEERILEEGAFAIEKSKERLSDVGIMSMNIPEITVPGKIRITLAIADTEYANEYLLWVYPKSEVSITRQSIRCEGKILWIAETEEQMKEYQEKKVPFIYIPKEREGDVEGTYCTDFWNYPMFRSISESMNRKVPVGTLGLCIDKEHELLKDFPCESYSTPQWYHLVMHSHCRVLDGEEGVETIVQPIDNVERCHKLGMLYYQEDMLVCTSRLWEIGECPEVKAFANALLNQLA